MLQVKSSCTFFRDLIPDAILNHHLGLEQRRSWKDMYGQKPGIAEAWPPLSRQQTIPYLETDLQLTFCKDGGSRKQILVALDWGRKIKQPCASVRNTETFSRSYFFFQKSQSWAQ